MPKQEKKSGKTIGWIAFVLGVLTLIFCWVPILGVILSIASVIVSGIALKKTESNKGLVIAALVMSIIGLLIAIVVTLITFVFVGVMKNIASGDNSDLFNSPNSCKSLIPDRIKLVYWTNENGVEIWSYLTVDNNHYSAPINYSLNDGTQINAVSLWFQKGWRTGENVNYLYMSGIIDYEKQNIGKDGTVLEPTQWRIRLVLDPNDNAIGGYSVVQYSCWGPGDLFGADEYRSM